MSRARPVREADPRPVPAPPINALEKLLVDVWRDVLDTDVGVDENFFDLGGTSLQAARVFERLEEALGVRLPISAAAERATVRELARWIETRAAADAPGRSLVRFSPAVGGRMFFCVHGLGGHVLVFGRLARLLEPITGFAAFESVGRNDLERRDDTIDAMASRYLADMRRVAPRGPYDLGGYSIGGIVALEMARRLRLEGETVGLVALLDSDLNAPPPEILAARVVEFVSKALGLDPPVDLPYERLGDAATQICERVNAGRRRGLWLRPDDVVRFAEIYLANASAMRGHEPEVYDGEVVLFYTAGGPNSHLPADTPPAEAARRMGLSRIVAPGGLRAVRVPGDHWTLLSDHVQALAAELSGALRAAHARSAAAPGGR